MFKEISGRDLFIIEGGKKTLVRKLFESFYHDFRFWFIVF